MGQTQYWLRLPTLEKNQTKSKILRTSLQLPCWGHRAPLQEGTQVARGCCFPATLRTAFPPPPNSLPCLSPLHCSVAGPAHVLHREVDGTAVTSQPSLGHLPVTATVELSNSERLCPEGQHLHCLAEIWSLELYHQSRVVKAPAVRWQTWEMTWEDARVSVIDSIDFILKTKQTNAIWVNSLQTRKSTKMEQGTTTSFRTPGLSALPQHRNQRFPSLGG